MSIAAAPTATTRAMKSPIRVHLPIRDRRLMGQASCARARRSARPSPRLADLLLLEPPEPARLGARENEIAAVVPGLGGHERHVAQKALRAAKFPSCRSRYATGWPRSALSRPKTRTTR